MPTFTFFHIGFVMGTKRAVWVFALDEKRGNRPTIVKIPRWGRGGFVWKI